MSVCRLSAILLETLVLFFLGCPALADAGLPMLIVVWPTAWLLLFMIIPVEAVLFWLLVRTSPETSFKVSTRANVASTIVGIPVTWIGLVVLEMVCGGGRVYGLETNFTRILAVTLQSPWLVPYPDDVEWMKLAAAAVLCVPFFFMSVAVEYSCGKRYVAAEKHALVLRWSWIGNGITYGIIIAWLLSDLSDVMKAHSDEKFGVVNLAGKFFRQPQSSMAVGSFSDGLAPVRSGKKWGYTDESGKYVIVTQFDEAEPFVEGMAQVTLAGKHTFIDRKGHQLVLSEPVAATGPFSEAVARVSVDGKYGFVDKTGKLVIKPQFEEAGSFSEGLCPVKTGGKWGYIDHEGKLAIEPQYECARQFSEELAAVKDRRDLWLYVDKQGQVVITLPELGQGGDFSEGLAEVTGSFGRPTGYIDKQGKMCIKGNLDRVQPFSEGLALVAVGAKRDDRSHPDEITDYRTSKYGFIDRNGSFVIAPNFDWARSFSQGRAAVQVEEHWGFIDKQGKMVIKPEFSWAEGFSGGDAVVGKRWAADQR